MNKKPIVKMGLMGLVLCLILLTPGCGVCGLVPGQVLIRDPQLELAIRHALNIPFACITRGDMTSLTDLDASSYGIRYLDGLESAVNIVNLDLSNNYIQDIGSLRDLDKLVTLVLSYNEIKIVEPVSGLDSLRFIDFTCNNYISNWDPVAAVVTTNNGFLEGGSVTFDNHSSTVDCEEESEETVCYTSSFYDAAVAISQHAALLNVQIDVFLGVPTGENTGQCIE